MEYETRIQYLLDEIDKRITKNIRIDELAYLAGYSVFHFSRIFTAITGMSVMTYVTQRKLEYALYDLSQGKKILDVAMDYGFKTHAGFTKAFNKYYGSPPSLYRLHIQNNLPERAEIKNIKQKIGVSNMQVQIKEVKPFSIVGVTSRHLMPKVKRSANLPAFWNTIKMDYGKHLSRLYDTFTPANHREYCICFDFDDNTGEFSYMLGVTFDDNVCENKIEADMKKIHLQGGMYAIFTTPKVHGDYYEKSIADTWDKILTRWFPESVYEYDDTRLDFEMYDERDHQWLHDTVQMDICVPIRFKGSKNN